MTEYFIAWWNLENLFDTLDSPTRPAWLQQKLKHELKGWDEAVVTRKIGQLTSIISQMNEGRGPDILGVCEIENQAVFEKLRDAVAPLGRNYALAHHDTADQRGIDIAFMYDDNLFAFENQFDYVVLKRNATRDLFQVSLKIRASGRDLVLVGNHWPSRLGGQYESEPYRIIAAETLSYWHERIKEYKGSDVPIVVMGDFNDEPFNRSLTDYALSTQSRAKVLRSRNPRLFNLMWPLMGRALGSHFYNNFPGMLDQFLVSKGLLLQSAPLKARLDSARIERFPEMQTGSYDVPRRFSRPSSSSYDEDGYSDHFPISMILEEQ